MKTVLFAVSGISPAILTETLWALALENPPVVPDEVVVITTQKGRRDLHDMLLKPLDGWNGETVWACLRRDLFAMAGAEKPSANAVQLSVHVITLPDAATGVRREAEDLRTHEDNAEAADFILQMLAPYADAEDTRVIASVAGGRKTMGALLYAAMSLIGKESDRITHVLVSEPFENCRGFFYPGQPLQELEARPFGHPPIPVRADVAVIDLADLAFVPLRNGFAEMNEGRRTFSGLVSRYSRDLQRLPGGMPRVSIELEKGILFVEEKRIALSGRTLLVASFLLERARRGLPNFENAMAAEGEFAVYVNDSRGALWNLPKLSRYLEAKSATGEDIVKALSDLRAKLAKGGAGNCIPFLAPERSRVGFEISAGALKLR